MKYIKPKSLSWWASVSPLLAGLIVAVSEAFPALAPAVAVINAASGGMTAPVLINLGLAGIGLRGAMKE
jgi:hypothetical protein